MDRTTDHDDERRLAEIERELAAADPALAAALSAVSPVRRPVWPWMALAVLGTVLLLLGFLVSSVPVVLLGTGCALVGSLVVAKSPAVEETRNRTWAGGRATPRAPVAGNQRNVELTQWLGGTWRW